jgi:DNA-directed RNA polymerase specialized sigma24 family protein
MNNYIHSSTSIYSNPVKALENINSSEALTRIKKYEPLLYKIAIGLGLVDKDCHEIIKYVCLYGVKNFIYQKESFTLKTWLSRMLIHKCIFKLGSQLFSQHSFVKSTLAHHTILNYDNVSQLPQMPLSYKTIYLLFYLKEFTEIEIAQVLNINLLQVRQRIEKAKLMIKNS